MPSEQNRLHRSIQPRASPDWAKPGRYSNDGCVSSGLPALAWLPATLRVQASDSPEGKLGSEHLPTSPRNKCVRNSISAQELRLRQWHFQMLGTNALVQFGDSRAPYHSTSLRYRMVCTGRSSDGVEDGLSKILQHPSPHRAQLQDASSGFSAFMATSRAARCASSATSAGTYIRSLGLRS